MDLVKQYRQTRLERLELKKTYDALEKKEHDLKDQIITELRGGTVLREVVLIEKFKATVTDWNLLYAHIKSTGEFDLLHRRVTDTAVQERWADGAKVPGVGRFPVYDIKVG